MCPNPMCQGKCVRDGRFSKKTGRAEKIQRFRCKRCGRCFSSQTGTLTYREKKPYVDQTVFRLLASGVSQRQIAEILGINRKTVAKKLVRLGREAGRHLRDYVAANAFGDCLVFDEMETHEHTKMKPLSIAVAVEEGSRRILAIEVASMPAKGLLAERSRRKYGRRRDDRHAALKTMCGEILRANPQVKTVKSDECPRYPGVVRKYLPGVTHLTFRGRRGCVVGQGELKATGRDPLFSLNHTAAMVRDNLKTMSRRTWCTVKRPDRLQCLLNVYAWCHNQRRDDVPFRRVTA